MAAASGLAARTGETLVEPLLPALEPRAAEEDERSSAGVWDSKGEVSPDGSVEPGAVDAREEEAGEPAATEVGWTAGGGAATGEAGGAEGRGGTTGMAAAAGVAPLRRDGGSKETELAFSAGGEGGRGRGAG